MVLTIDAGTSGCKSILFDLHGKIFSDGFADYRVHETDEGYVELDQSILLDAVKKSVTEAISTGRYNEILGICISAQLGMVVVDKQGNALFPIITWIDKRADVQVETIRNIFDEKTLYKKSGRNISAELTAPKLLWLMENKSDEMKRALKVLSIKDFLVHYLTDEFVTDPIHASYSLMFDVKEQKWNYNFIDKLGIDIEMLPEVKPCHEVVGLLSRKAAEYLSLAEDIPVINGGPDGSIGVFGAGLIQEGSVVNMVGTSDVVFALSKKPRFDPEMKTIINNYAISDRWAIGGPMSTTGGCLKWFVEDILLDSNIGDSKSVNSDYLDLMKRVENISPGSDGLYVIPSQIGERTPFWDPYMKGVFWGLTLSHRREHVVRAILEGSSFLSRNLIELLISQEITVNKVIMVGGGAKNHIWARIRADIFGIPVVVPKVINATCLGSAFLIYIGLGIYNSFTETVQQCLEIEKTISPIQNNYHMYNQIFKKFMELHSIAGKVYSSF
jgi:xylulokinase